MQVSGKYEYHEGGSLERCGELCVADTRCWSTNFYHTHEKFEGRPACALHVGQDKPTEYKIRGTNVYGGCLKPC